MSMFRPAAEISSSPDSSEEDDRDELASQRSSKNVLQTGLETGQSSSLLADNNSTDQDVDIKELLNTDAESHSNFMTAALLEFYCFTRAADYLNKQDGSHKRYTRDSPEVQCLGKKLYSFQSRFLSSHGVLAEGVETDEWGSTRQYYRDNLDALGLTALDGLKLDDKNSRQAELGAVGDLVRSNKASESMQIQSSRDAENLLGAQSLVNLRRRQIEDRNIPSLENLPFEMRNIPRQPFAPFGSSPASFPLFDISPPQPHRRMSRYAVEFSEIKILGRGSFGEVYHVKNHIDGQNYAVKKIPLSQRRLEQLQCGNENQLEAIMKEIRTLARLEHANVVRYYGAWIEESQFPRRPPAIQQTSANIEYESVQDSLLGDTEQDDDESFGIVFESSTGDKLTASVEDESVPYHSDDEVPPASPPSKRSYGRSLEDDVESIPRSFGNQSYSQLSTFGASDGDIFTDGLSHDASKLQVQRRRRNGAIPAVVLHIQMSLHPISLSSYLNPQQLTCASDTQTLPRRHCFHLIPSLRLMLNIMSGVDYLHAKGIVHRDLKPANIFLSPSEYQTDGVCPRCYEKDRIATCYCHPRIGDFGLVADISHFNDYSPKTPTSRNPSKLNRVVGTEFYCPPLRHHDKTGLLSDSRHGGSASQHTHYTVDETLDVYALGVILFELLYRVNTKMERQLVLTELTRGSQKLELSSVRDRPLFPTDFAQKIDQGSVALCNGISVADALKACIKGMLELQPQCRWRCADVRKCLHEILLAVQGNARIQN